MFGLNPRRSIVNDEGTSLFIKEIFYTIQGEGPFVGMPAVFVRLGGCNLACKFCDTEFEDFEAMSLDDIIFKVQSLRNKANLIVLTGGEPLRQSIAPLCELLLSLGFMVQIETNGTIYRDLPSQVHIVCSPKSSSQGYFRIREDLLPKISAIKFLISKSNPKYSNVAEIGQSDYNIPVFIQPMDQYDKELNEQNLQLTLEISQVTGYRISTQIHKIYGIP